MTQGNEISVLNIRSTLFSIFCLFLTGVHHLGEINYCIGSGIGKTNILFIALLLFTLIVAILPVKSPCTIFIILIGTPVVILVVVVHGGCCQVFVI